MSFRIYNTLTKKKGVFKPISGRTVKVYDCGPTVYGYAHLGNMRRYLMSDVLKRYLRYREYEVVDVMNITDVGHLTQDDIDSGEDKVLKAARREGKSPKEIADFYTKAFFADADKLNILRASIIAKATDHIEAMIGLVEKLLMKGYAYEIEGTVYFDVTRYEKYGQLSGNTLDRIKGLKVGARSEIKEEEFAKKRHPFDFVLWFRAPEEHLMKWDSPWGKGYPGWHIECSAMSLKYLGSHFDIHTGGVDNIFPHHEDEIAQSEAANDERFVNYWVHAKHLKINDEKIAKSIGNVVLLKDIEAKGHHPLAFRLFVLQNHYRSEINFTWEKLEQASKELKRIWDFVGAIESLIGANSKAPVPENSIRRELVKSLDQLKDNFEAHMDNDLSTAQALDDLFVFIRAVNSLREKAELNANEAMTVRNQLTVIDKVFGLVRSRPARELPARARELLAARELERSKQNWEEADRLRDELREMDIEIEDTARGQRWRYIK